MSDLKRDLYLVADEIRNMATLTDHFAWSIYERERAQRLIGLAARVAALAGDDPLPDVEAAFSATAWKRYSPAIGVESAVFDADDRLLLIQRADSGKWALPGGLAEVGQSLPDAALRELWEEAGVRGEVTRVLGIFDGPKWGTQTRVHLVHVVFAVQAENLSPEPGVETLAAAFFAHDHLPDLHGGHTRRVPPCFDLRQGDTYFDPVKSADLNLTDFQRPIGFE